MFSAKPKGQLMTGLSRLGGDIQPPAVIVLTPATNTLHGEDFSHISQSVKLAVRRSNYQLCQKTCMVISVEVFQFSYSSRAFPAYEHTVSKLLILGVAEILIILWLLIKGARVQPLDYSASASAGG
jgi:hypothetical protein